MNTKIEGGYYIKARKIEGSEIQHAPPHVREIWDYLVRKANHKDYNFMGKTIKRGELLTSYKKIIEDLSWRVGFRIERYNKNHCEISMKWYMKRNMVHTKKTTRGFFIQIVNYDYYQNPDNYESDNETDKKHTRNIQSIDTINKNDKNEKNTHTSKDGRYPCTDEELKTVSEDLQVSLEDVKSVHESILESIEAKEFKHKTVYYTLRKWVRYRIEKGTMKKITSLPKPIFTGLEGFR